MPRPFLALVLAATACVDVADPDDLTTEVPAPLVGVDGATDQADQACHVVLRALARPRDGAGGFVTDGSSWVWEGEIELSLAAVADGAIASAMYQYGSDPSWYQVDATATTTPATPGFARYRVRLAGHLPGPGMSGSALASARVQVAAFARLAGGGRLFDHNRLPGTFDNYTLVAGNQFAVPVNDAVCASAGPTPPARVVFAADGSVTQHGAMVPGGMVRVEYDPARLPACRSTSDGAPLWDITAHVRWNTGEGQSSSIRDGAALVSIPTTARAMELWFENTAPPACRAWDSNLGANYRFDLLLPPAWLGAASVRISRDTSGDPCDGADAAAGFDFDTWSRQRAAITNLCFRVWSPGVTDRDDPELWRKLDATVRWRPRGSSEPLRSIYAPLLGRFGNDARYALDLRTLDPFRPYQCPSVPTTPTPDGMYVRAELEYVIVVNGVELRPAPGAYYSATFTDYRTSTCP